MNLQKTFLGPNYLGRLCYTAIPDDHMLFSSHNCRHSGVTVITLPSYTKDLKDLAFFGTSVLLSLKALAKGGAQSLNYTDAIGKTKVWNKISNRGRE